MEFATRNYIHCYQELIFFFESSQVQQVQNGNLWEIWW